MLRLFSVIIVVVLGGLIAALYILPGMIDWQKYKQPLLERLNAISPYAVSISGDISLQLLPEPFIAIGGVHFRDGEREVFTVEQARLELALAPLFERKIEVKTLALKQPKAFVTYQDVSVLQAYSSGQRESDITQDTAQPLPRFIQNVSISNFSIQDGFVSYLAAKGADAVTVDIKSSQFEMQSLKGPYKFVASFNTKNIKQIAITATAQEVTEDILPVTINAIIDNGQASVDYGGIIALRGTSADEASMLPFDLQGQFSATLRAALSPLKQDTNMAGFLDVSGNNVTLDRAALAIDDMAPFAFTLDTHFKDGDVSVSRLQASSDKGFSLNASVELKSIGSENMDYIVKLDEFKAGSLREKFPKDVLPFVDSLKTATIQGKSNADFSGLDFVLNAQALTGSLKAQGKISQNQLQNAAIDFEAPNAMVALKQFPDLGSIENGYITAAPLMVLARMNMQQDGALYISQGKIKSGELSSDFSATLPNSADEAIEAKISLPKLSLEKLGGVPSASISANRKAALSEPQFSRNAIDVTWLRDLPSLNIQMSVGELVVSRDMAFTDTTALISGGQGGLEIKEGQSILRGDKASFAYDLILKAGKTPRDPLSVKGDMRVQSLRLPYLIERVTSRSFAAIEGIGNLNLSFETSGISPAALVLDLDGEGLLDLNSLVLKGIDIQHFSESLSDGGFAQLVEATLLQRSILQGQTAFKDVSMPFNIAEGYLTLPKTEFANQSGKMDLQGGYDISVGQAEFKGSIRIDREIKALEGALPSLPFIIKGPVKSLAFELDTSAVDAALQRAIKARIDAEVEKQKRAIAEKLQAKQAEIESRAKAFAPILNELLQKPILPELEVREVEPVIQPPQQNPDSAPVQ